MKDISEFEKLFKVNIPVHKHYEYYVETLSKSAFYAGIGAVAKEFEQYELDVEANGYSSARSYKLDYALPKIKNFILDTRAYKLFSNFQITSNLRTKDELRKNDDTYLISIDFKSANYSSIKVFDSENELLGSWEEFCVGLGIHPTLAKSKSFRQYVFGNIAPKKLQKYQHFCINKIVDKLIEKGSFVEDDFVFISHDEFIVRLRPDHKLAVNRIHLLNSEVGRIISEENINMPTHYKVFKNEALGAGMCVQTQYQVKMGGLSEKFKTLFKVPGNKFYLYFKKHILKEPIDKRDLMFMVDNDVCVWHESGESIAETIVPDGEISFDEAKIEYPYFIEEIKKNIPGLSDSQIRKIVNITINLCSHCKNSDTKCNCWKNI